MNKNASLDCRAKEVQCRRDHVVLRLRGGVTTWPDNAASHIEVLANSECRRGIFGLSSGNEA